MSRLVPSQCRDDTARILSQQSLLGRCGRAYEVRFMTLDGETIYVVTLEASQVRTAGERETTHTREQPAS